MRKLKDIVKIVSLYKSEIIGISVYAVLAPLVLIAIHVISASTLGMAILSAILFILSLVLLAKLS